MKSFAKTLTLALLPLSLATVQAAQAGTVHVPLPGISGVGSVSYKTQISITNSGGEPVAVESLELAPGVDGTQREGVRANRLSIAPFKTFILRPAAAARGVMELSGAPGITYNARLVGSNGSSVELPVITEAARGRENGNLIVQGLSGVGSTDLVVMNLGATAATCSASLVRADGGYAIEPVEISLLPLSHLVFANLLRDFPGLSEARAEVSCSNEFYVYALRSDAATGQVAISGPSSPSDDLTSVFESLVITPAYNCAPGKAVCEQLGVVHTPTKAKTALFIGMTPPVDTYKILRAHVEVQVTGFNPINQGGAHGVLWLIINNNKKLIGSIFLRGAGKNNVTLRHGVCPGVCNKTKVEKGFPLTLGSTYVFDYEYNTTTRKANMRMSLNNQLVAQIEDRTEVNNLFINPGDLVVIGLSNPDPRSRVEPPSLGWVYSNLRVEFLK